MILRICKEVGLIFWLTRFNMTSSLGRNSFKLFIKPLSRCLVIYEIRRFLPRRAENKRTVLPIRILKTRITRLTISQSAIEFPRYIISRLQYCCFFQQLLFLLSLLFIRRRQFKDWVVVKVCYSKLISLHAWINIDTHLATKGSFRYQEFLNPQNLLDNGVA